MNLADYILYGSYDVSFPEAVHEYYLAETKPSVYLFYFVGDLERAARRYGTGVTNLAGGGRRSPRACFPGDRVYI